MTRVCVCVWTCKCTQWHLNHYCICVLFTQCRQACPDQPLLQKTLHLHLHCFHCLEPTDHTETQGSHSHHCITQNTHAPYYLSLLFEHWQCLCGLSVLLSDVTLFNLYVTCVCTVLLTWFASPVAGWSAPAPPASSSKRQSPSASRAAPSVDGNCSPPESHKTPGNHG